MARPKGPKIPVPADFIEVAPTMTLAQLKKRYGVGQIVLQRWLEETVTKTGGQHNIFKSRPEDFVERIQRMPRCELNRHYGVGWRVLERWRQEVGMEYTRGPRSGRPVPADFADVAPTMTRLLLKAHYNTSEDTLRRWVRDSGIMPKVYTPPGKGERIGAHVTTPAASGFVFGGHARIPVLRDMRTKSLYDDAADVLRRERFVVFRCDTRGRADQKGTHWRSGNTLLTPDELLQRADKYRAKERA